MKISHVKNLPEVGLSHNPEIKKKVIVPKGEVPHLMTFGQATFRPGQFVEPHKHDTMYEIYYVLSGEAIFVVDGKEISVQGGDSITIGPGEMHSQKNISSADVTWLYFGIESN